MIYLSVIIPTRNRAKYLSGALDSLTRQPHSSDLFEVIVVDNGSTDNTKEICETYRNQIHNLRYYYDTTPGLHVGRHLGLKMAKAENLVYADDDIEAFPTWLEGIAEAFQDNEVVLVGGKNLPKFETEPPDWILKMWEKDQNGNRILGYLSILDLGDEKKEINPYHVFGCNFSIRKSVLLEAGGFHPDAMPQELIKYRGDGESHVSRYILEKGYKTLYHPKASVYHLVPSSRLSKEYFCRRAYNEGISYSYTQLRNEYLGNADTKQGYHKFADYYRRLKQMTITELFKAGGRKLRKMFCLKMSDPYADINKMIDYSYQDGWRFHQNEIINDPKLLEWVIKGNYYN